ncbi:MAG: M28 family peptidase [Planctomycetota bacterium]
MHFRHAFPLLLVLAACGAPQESADPSSASHAASAPVRVDADAAQRLQADVAWLADDAREGRRAGTEGARAAGEWIAARFTELGIPPAGERGYCQDFTVPLEPRDGGTTTLELGAGSVWRAPDVVPLFCSEGGDVRGPLVFCGYGIEYAERQWNDYEGRDVHGAVVMVVRGLPASAAQSKPDGDTELVTKGDGWGPSGSIFNKIMTAKRKGAAAVVLVQPDGEPLLRFDSSHSARAGIPAVTVTAQVAEQLMPGYAATLGAPGGTKDAAVRELRVATDVVRENGTAFNVLARLPGRDRTRAVVVGAHYDHLGRGGTGSLAPNDVGNIHNGADDNASGTAAVLEMARTLASGAAPACDVVFALWSGEELGLLGSEHWAVHPTISIAQVTANLNLDMVGRAGSGALQVLGAGTSPAFESWLARAAERAGLTLTVNKSGSAMGGSSDHQTFVKRKIPALHLFSGLHSDYHKPSDDIERFEAEGTARVAHFGALLTLDLARASAIPFVEPKVDKERDGAPRAGFRTWFGSVPSYVFEGPGVRLDGTSPGSPAERAGLLAGDIVRSIGEVKTESVYDLTYALQLYKPGDVVLVKYERDGAPQEVRLTMATRELQ